MYIKINFIEDGENVHHYPGYTQSPDETCSRTFFLIREVVIELNAIKKVITVYYQAVIACYK